MSNLDSRFTPPMTEKSAHSYQLFTRYSQAHPPGRIRLLGWLRKRRERRELRLLSKVQMEILEDIFS